MIHTQLYTKHTTSSVLNAHKTYLEKMAPTQQDSNVTERSPRQLHSCAQIVNIYITFT